VREGPPPDQQSPLSKTAGKGILPRMRFSPMHETWNRIGIDTLHLTFKTGGDLAVSDLLLGLGDVFDEMGLSGDFTQRHRGRHGFEHGVSFREGIECDWTDHGGDGPNVGFAALQIKGEFFEPLGALEVAYLGLVLDELGVHKCTRVDPQITALDCPLASDLIKEFRSGRLKIVRKQTFEGRGQELEGGFFPKGATLYHGSRQSETFGRQYDKHLQPGADGPPRLRSECELKGKTANAAWKHYVEGWKAEAQSKPTDLKSEVRLSQQFVRYYMPLRDVSAWAADRRPKAWASEAPEPAWWASLFEERAMRVRKEKSASKTLLKAIQHARKQGGGRFLQDLVLDEIRLLRNGYPEDLVNGQALRLIEHRYAAHASETRLQELLENLPEHEHALARELWFGHGRQAGDLIDEERDEELNPLM